MEQVVVALATELKARGHEPHVICTARRGVLSAEVEAFGIPVHECFFESARDNLGSKRLSSVLRGIGAQVVHSQTGVWLGAVTAARRAGIRATCHTEHGLTSLHEGWKLRVQKVIAARLTEAIVSVSDPLHRILVAQCLVSPRRILRIDNGVPVEKYLRDVNLRREVRNELAIRDDALVIGTAGRLQHLKGFDVLLTALREASFSRPVSVVLAGDGEDRSILEELAAQSAVPIQLLGERRDIPRLMQAYDIFVLPSRSEGLPMALLEGMASGLGIVATAVGEMPKVLQDDAGIVVPPNSPDQILGALQRMAVDDQFRADCGDVAMKRVSERYSRQHMVSSYEQLYVQIMNSTN